MVEDTISAAAGMFRLEALGLDPAMSWTLSPAADGTDSGARRH